MLPHEMNFIALVRRFSLIVIEKSRRLNYPRIQKTQKNDLGTAIDKALFSRETANQF